MAAFPVFFLLSWLFIALFAVIPKKLTLIENTLIYLVVLVISINFSWIVIEELKLITLTKNGLDYTAFLMNRSITIPILILLQINLFYRNTSSEIGFINIVFSVTIMLATSFLSTFLHVTDYTKWNLFYDLIYYFALHILAYLALKSFRKVTKSTVRSL